MLCPSCGHNNLGDAEFCEQCATELGLVCKSCQTPNQVGARFCRRCREPLRTAASAKAQTSTPTPSPSPALPTAFAGGRYRVQRFLGEGGRKRVYLAHDAKLDRDVAIAVIKTEGLDSAGLSKVQREAQAMGRLGDHPHIVTVFDVGDEGGQPYIVSQHMRGGDLEGLLQTPARHRLTPAHAQR